MGAIKEKKQHGGARPGSGRPSLGKVSLYLRLSEDVKRKVEDYANRRKITLSDAAEQMIRAFHEIPLSW